MDHTGELLSISAFARRVGLAPSALRFYDDCRILPPARVDPGTGYRQYSPEQKERARLLRELRAAGLPLAEVAVVLDGDPAEARAVLEGHRARVRERGRAADAVIGTVLGALTGAPGATGAVLGGVELASAARQVAPAAGRDPRHPVVSRVLIEIEDGEVRLVATDRHRLALRTLRPVSVSGPPGRLLIEASELLDLGAWAARSVEVTLETDASGARARRGDGEMRELASTEGEFPAYREMLAALTPPAHRVLVDRAALTAALDACGDAPAVVLELGPDRLRTALPDGSRATVLRAIRQEEGPLRIGFDPAVLAPALESGVGPDVLLEIAAPAEPVVVRSADQGSFTALVMPVALDAPEGAGA